MNPHVGGPRQPQAWDRRESKMTRRPHCHPCIELLETRRHFAGEPELLLASLPAGQGFEGVNVNQTIAVGNKLFFIGDQYPGTERLWVTDGTGTPVHLFTGTDSLEFFSSFRDKLLFFAQYSGGSGLFATDGSTPVLLK